MLYLQNPDLVNRLEYLAREAKSIDGNTSTVETSWANPLNVDPLITPFAPMLPYFIIDM